MGDQRSEVKGKVIDDETRCTHYHSVHDRIAIKFKCCLTYYPCIHCHEEEAEHAVQHWPRDSFHTQAVLCGTCGTELTIQEYLNAEDNCPFCSASFNPGCRLHHHLYFEMK